MKLKLSAMVALLGGSALVVGCGGTSDMEMITPQMLQGAAPDTFVVAFETSRGTFDMKVYRIWSPAGADRLYQLATLGFYDGARFYRVEPGFVAQWGFSGKPAVDSLLVQDYIPAEPVRASNLRGRVTYARAGAGTRSTQLFVNLGNNRNLDMPRRRDEPGFQPIGEIESGLEVLDSLYAGYSADPPRQDSIARFGNDYLRRHYPQLDSIISTTVIRSSGGSGGS